jgi:hypothetical protein
MRTPVEIYRGIAIRKSPMALLLPQSQTPPLDQFEANLQGWLLVGPLQSVRDKIDQMLGPEEDPGAPPPTPHS